MSSIAGTSSQEADAGGVIFGSVFILAIVGFIVYLCVAGGIAANPRGDNPPGPPAVYTTNSYLATLGLDPTKAYPLVLGSTIDGTNGGFNSKSQFSSFFFLIFGSASSSGSSSGQFESSRSVLVKFTAADGSSYIFPILFDNIRWLKWHPDSKQIIFFVTHSTVITTEKWQSQEHGGSFWGLSHARLSWSKPRGPRQTPYWHEIETMGLVKYLQTHLVRIWLRVPPKVQNALLQSRA